MHALVQDGVEPVLPPAPGRHERAEHERAEEVAHQIFAFFHGWATLAVARLIDGSRVMAVDRAVSALIESNRDVVSPDRALYAEDLGGHICCSWSRNAETLGHRNA
jgi:hypothetical protein